MKKGKWNIIDWIIIGLIIACAVGVFVRFGQSDTKLSNVMSEIVYTMEVKNIRPYSVTALEKKGDLWDPKLKKRMGTILDVQVSDAMEGGHLVNGTYVVAPIPGRHDVLLTIQTKGKVSNTSIYAESTQEICVGKEYTMQTPWSIVTGTVRSVELLPATNQVSN